MDPHIHRGDGSWTVVVMVMINVRDAGAPAIPIETAEEEPDAHVRTHAPNDPDVNP